MRSDFSLNTAVCCLKKNLNAPRLSEHVVVVFTLKTVLTSIQYLLFFLTLQGKEMDFHGGRLFITQLRYRYRKIK